MEIAELMDIILQNSGITQAELARRLCWSQQRTSLLWTRKHFSSAEVEKIAKACGFTLHFRFSDGSECLAESEPELVFRNASGIDFTAPERVVLDFHSAAIAGSVGARLPKADRIALSDGNLGNNLRRYRLQAGISQKRLAGITGMWQQRIDELEKIGLERVTLRTLKKLAAALNVSVADLISEDTE